MRNEIIKSKWTILRTQKGVQRIDADHPLNFFARINERNQEQLILVTAVEPVQLKSSKGLYIEKNKRKDGLWATQISNEVKSNVEVFAVFCQDLMDASENAISEIEGLQIVINRFVIWQNMFESINKTLPRNTLKGLIGELKFASECLSTKLEWSVILEGWRGPDAGDRDFVFANSWYEVKAIKTGKSSVTISSLDQLDSDNEGRLVVFRIDDSSSTDPNGINVRDYIRNIRKQFGGNLLLEKKFAMKLVEIGYVEKPEYADIWFSFNGIEEYFVNETFPKLTRKDIPAQITEAKYNLSLPTLSNWLIKE